VFRLSWDYFEETLGKSQEEFEEEMAVNRSPALHTGLSRANCFPSKGGALTTLFTIILLTS